jgi:hypothetical protein
MSYIYFVTPVGSDPQYLVKREILAEISRDTGREFFFPLERRGSFSMNVARRDLRDAALVVADLSLERPSCYFELGVAQALDVPVCIVAAEGTRVHQTAPPASVHSYSSLREYRTVILQAVTGCKVVIMSARE